MTKLKPFLACVLLAIAASGVSLNAACASPTVDVRQAAALQSNGALLIDVRETDEYAEAHAPGSVLIPLGQLQQRLPEIRELQEQAGGADLPLRQSFGKGAQAAPTGRL